MALTPTTCLQTRDCWRLCAHALGHLLLGQAGLMPGTHEGIEERKFLC